VSARAERLSAPRGTEHHVYLILAHPGLSNLPSVRLSQVWSLRHKLPASQCCTSLQSLDHAAYVMRLCDPIVIQLVLGGSGLSRVKMLHDSQRASQQEWLLTVNMVNEKVDHAMPVYVSLS
jgi:hypothetical protein